MLARLRPEGPAAPGPAWPAGFLAGRAAWVAATAFAVLVALGFALGRTYPSPAPWRQPRSRRS